MMKYKKWDLEFVSKEAKKYKSRTAFQKGSKEAYESARKRGFLDTVCEHMKPLQKKWSHKVVKLEAKKYKTRTQFSKGSPGAYFYATKHGILDIVCSHMLKKLNVN